EELAEAFEHVFGEPRFLEDRTHEGEKRNGEQQLLRHDIAEKPQGDGVEETCIEEARGYTESRERDPHGGKGKGDRITDQQKDNEPQEHEWGDVDRLHAYCTGFS